MVCLLLIAASDILLDPFTYVFYNASYSHSGGPPMQQPGNYSTDTIRDFGLGYLDQALKKRKDPFFIGSKCSIHHSPSARDALLALKLGTLFRPQLHPLLPIHKAPSTRQRRP